MRSPNGQTISYTDTDWPPQEVPTPLRSLSYGKVLEILQGVSEVMYRGERFYEASFLVREDSLGDIAIGRLLRNRPQ